MFVQTDNTAGNRVVAYDRAADGTLTPADSYATGGRGRGRLRQLFEDEFREVR